MRRRLWLGPLLILAIGACGKRSATSSAGPMGSGGSPDGGVDAGGPDAAGACVPLVTPNGIVALDQSSRVLNARGVHLVDWDGFLANPTVTITLKPPADITFPATATITADEQRLYFDMPSTVGATGPSKSVAFADATTTVDIRLAIFPDRDGLDEQHVLTMALDGADPRPEAVPITVHDQDQNQPILTPILVDYTSDTTMFFANATARQVVQQAADDWAYFLDDMMLDPVPAMDETTSIWGPDGFVSQTTVQNSAAYTGFLLYAYGIHSAALRSGGEGDYAGKPQTSGGQVLPLRRSGGLEVETQGNYNTLGWIMDLDPESWWKSANQGNQQNDLYSIVHHEMGHAHGFNGAYPLFVAARPAGLTSPGILAYIGHPIALDASDHFAGTIDPASGVGAFGNEYHGVMPLGRWLITRTDVLALAAVGYKIRPITFEPWTDDRPDCP